MPTPEEQQQRAIAALQAVWAGGNLGEETQKLSNEFTDRQTARFAAWLRRLFRR